MPAEALAVLLLAALAHAEDVPQVKFDVLRSGGFRVSIPAPPNATRFKFGANINRDLDVHDGADLNADVTAPTHGFFVAQFDAALKAGDVINFRYFLYVGRLGYNKQGLTETVSDLHDTYPPLPAVCSTSITTVRGNTLCKGGLIIDEEFQGGNINTDVWVIEHRIPLSSEFNSYENRDDTRFVRNEVLYLKPIAKTSKADVAGTLDLQQGCTAKNRKQCFAEQRGIFILPPVRSGRVTSKVPFKYGKIEVRAKLPAGEWIFPVIELSLEEEDEEEYKPRVVIAGSRGNDRLTGPAGDIGSRLLYAGPVLDEFILDSQLLQTLEKNEPFSNAFHTYVLEWLPGSMAFYVDNEQVGMVDTSKGLNPSIDPRQNELDAPFNREYYLSLGVAVGGCEYFPEGYVSGSHARPWDCQDRGYVYSYFNARDEWSSTWQDDNSALQVEYVKVYSV